MAHRWPFDMRAVFVEVASGFWLMVTNRVVEMGGLVAALELATAGLEVIVVERAGAPGVRCVSSRLTGFGWMPPPL